MTGTIISTSISHGVTLTVAGDNPVSITSAGTVYSTGAYGIGFADGIAWTVVNSGLVTATGAGSIGMDFSADTVGVKLTNSGSIAGAADAVLFGSGNDKLSLEPGAAFSGKVDGGGGNNTLKMAVLANTTGTLTGFSTEYVNFQTVGVNAGATWVVNATDTFGSGVQLYNGGTLTGNIYLSGATLTNDAGDTITGFTDHSSGDVTSGNIYGLASTGTSIDNLGAIDEYLGIRFRGTGIVTNQGTIQAVSSLSGVGYGVYLRHGGTVTNGLGGPSTALIEGYNAGISGSPGSGSSYYGTVTNYGTILATGASYNAINLSAGGTVVNGPLNATSADIQGTRYGVFVGTGGVTNYEYIVSTSTNPNGAGVVIESGTAEIANLGAASRIEGFTGVEIFSYGTVTNAGTIASNQGSGGVAVKLGDAAKSRLIVDPGAIFVGSVLGHAGGGPGNVIELASASGIGTLTGLGTSFANFNAVEVDANAHWVLSGGNAIYGGGTFGLAAGGELDITGAITGGGDFLLNGGTLRVGTIGNLAASAGFDFNGTQHGLLALGGASGTIANTISQFGLSDTIDVTSLAYHSGASATVSGDLLQIVSNGTTVDLTTSGLTDGRHYFTEDDGNNGVEVVACFAPGTRIATPGGEVAIERLRIGEMVITGGGEPCRVKWIGRRSYAARFVAANPQLRPVRIRAGALADGVPHRDLLVSPSHALLLEGALIPAGALVNGASITREPCGGDVVYLHVELDRHEVILAEGASAESFVDLDSRQMFQNAAEYSALYPDASPRAAAPQLPRLEEGPAVAAAHQYIAARAGIAPEPAVPGQLRGHVERIVARGQDEVAVEGWVLDTARPTMPVELLVLCQGSPAVRVTANRYRVDLDRANLADGRCGFSVIVAGQGPVQVCRAIDGAELAVDQPPRAIGL